MTDLQEFQRPELRQPILIAAWAGWNDAGESATSAIRFMQRRWRAPVFAQIDPDPYYDFTQTRPRVRLEQGERVLDWPANSFTAHRIDAHEHDVILLQGVEPHFGWRSYCRAVMELCRTFQVRAAITLGALLAEASHARPIRTTGSSEDEWLRDQLHLPAPQLPGYQGPTGIVGVLNNVLHDEGIPAASIWANVPYYLNATPNPKGALALLELINEPLHLGLRLHDLEVFVARFDAQVAEEVAKNPGVAEYARQIEETEDAGGPIDLDDEVDDDGDELPDAEAVVDELERFLRGEDVDESDIDDEDAD